MVQVPGTGTRTQKQNKITINRRTLYGSGTVMYRTGATKFFPFIFETYGTVIEYQYIFLVLFEAPYGTVEKNNTAP